MPNRERSVGRWISILYRMGLVHISAELDSLDIGKGQHTFLAELFHRDGLSQMELARELNMDKGAVARALVKLERSGYVERVQDQADARIVRVYLSEQARTVQEKLFSVLGNWTDTLTEGFTIEEKDRALDYLRRMTENAMPAVRSQYKEEEQP